MKSNCYGHIQIYDLPSIRLAGNVFILQNGSLTEQLWLKNCHVKDYWNEN